MKKLISLGLSSLVLIVVLNLTGNIDKVSAQAYCAVTGNVCSGINTFSNVIVGTTTSSNTGTSVIKNTWGSSATDALLSVIGTAPTVPTTSTAAVNLQVTTAGSAAFSNYVLSASSLPGYTGTSLNATGLFSNTVNSTTTNVFNGNTAIFGTSTGTGTINTGVRGSAANGTTVNMGLIGSAMTAGTLNVGTVGFANNATNNIGGYFALGSSIPITASGAGIFNNGSVAQDVIGAYDNDVKVFSIPDGGGILLAARTFGTLGTPANGTFYYCSDCTIANPCAGAGTGALAKRLNAVWVCN